mmetsp:Transcript_13712/g.27353  ORF Transcript_13712/g.27353 Transcript_13712/m.27353 type:complete len:218 (-) Transcript_13712:880-1533(-)
MDVVPNQTLYVSHVHDKLKKQETRKLLYALFGQFGRVIDVVHVRREELRGRAWIVYEDVAGAANALRNLQDFPFYGIPLKIDYAKTKSDAAAKLDGTWRRDGRTRKVRIGQEAAEEMDVDLQEEETRGGQKATVVQDVGEPHTVLFAEGLPEATTEAMLKVLFSQFPGYIESRLVPGKPGIAFVDFETVQQAGVAITGLQGFKITAQNQMKLSYAKK